MNQAVTTAPKTILGCIRGRRKTSRYLRVLRTIDLSIHDTLLKDLESNYCQIKAVFRMARRTE